MPAGAIGLEFDAAIIGAGPGGSIAARQLAKLGHSVAIVSPVRQTRERAETLPPSSRRLYRLLGIDREIDSAGFYQTSGNTAWWGSSEERIETYPESEGGGYQVLRQDFDRLLLQCAKRTQAVHFEASVKEASEGVLRLGTGITIRTQFVIDASGRRGIVARQGLRVQEDAYRTVAITGAWQTEPDPTGHTLIESYSDGWAWSVPVSQTRRFLTVMVDTKTAQPNKSQGLPAIYTTELAKTSRIARGIHEGKVWACDASLYRASSYAGPWYLLAGDAGTFIDPLSSYGVKKAMSSGWLAAIVVHTCLSHPERTRMALDYYDNREKQISSDQTRQTAAQFRAANGTHPFWTARSVTPSHTAFYTEPELTATLDRIRKAPALQLRRSASINRKPVARIVGSEIVEGDGLTAPGLPAGLEYLEGVHLWKLAEMAETFTQVPDLYDAYNRTCQPVALPNFLSALSVLIAKNVLTHQEVA